MTNRRLVRLYVYLIQVYINCPLMLHFLKIFKIVVLAGKILHAALSGRFAPQAIHERIVTLLRIVILVHVCLRPLTCEAIWRILAVTH